MSKTWDHMRRTQQLLDSFLNLTSDGIVVVDLMGRVLEVNRKFEEMHGWTREEVIGQILPMTPEAFLDEAYQIYQRIIEGEQQSCLETLKLRKDGSTFYADVTISPIRDENGAVIAFVGVERDISERKKAEEQLEESERQYRRLLKLSPVAIILHRDGIIQFINDIGIKLFGGNGSQDFVERSIFDFIACEEHPKISGIFNRIVQSDECLNFIETKLVRVDGTILDGEISSIYVHKHMGYPVIQTVVHDSTERKKTEELIRRSEKLSVIGQLAAGIAHEIRNPLTSLKGFTKLLKTQTGQNDYIKIMMDELDRIEHIVNEFMSMAKPHTSNFKEVELPDLVKNVVQFMEPQALLYDVQILCEADRGMQPILCDQIQIKQVLMNVLKNAMEAMPQGGTVQIQVKKMNDEFALIRITDEGTGIPEDQLLKVGEPFFTMKENGTGLGLMICHSIVEAHKGKMSIQSQLNQGTTVEIMLPFVEKILV